MDQKRTRVIAVGNQKGGVGKTTNTVHIARALVEKGRKVLLIDLDMNHGATQHFGVVPEAFMGSYEMLVGDEQASNLILTHQDEDVSLPADLDLIPAARKLEGVDKAMTQKSKFITPREVLLAPLTSLQGQYDYIFLDTAPNATTPTNSLRRMKIEPLACAHRVGACTFRASSVRTFWCPFWCPLGPPCLLNRHCADS